MSLISKTMFCSFALWGLSLTGSQAQLIKPVESLASSGVVRIGINEDDNVASYILNMTNFSFWGTTYKGLTVSTNGVVTFGNTGYNTSNPSNLGMPRGTFPGIWAAQDDWRQSSGSAITRGYIYYKIYSDGMAITWANVLHAPSVNSGATNTFQVFLYNNGDIGLGYDDLNKVDNYVVGLNKGNSADYLSLVGLNTGQTAFSETGYASISKHQYLFRWDGTQYTSDLITQHSVSGKVNLQECKNLAQPLTFTFRPTDGSATFVRTQTLAADGSFSFSNIPARNYHLAIKGIPWLQTVIPANASDRNVSGLAPVLLTGDINNDNVVGLDDLGLLSDAFDTVPGNALWNPDADLNCDGTVNLDDLGLLSLNFDLIGDP